MGGRSISAQRTGHPWPLQCPRQDQAQGHAGAAIPGSCTWGSTAWGGDVVAGNGADGNEGCGCDEHPLKSAQHHCNLAQTEAPAGCCYCLPPRAYACPHGLPGVPHSWLSSRQRAGALQMHSWCQQDGKWQHCKGPPYSEATCAAAPACSRVVKRSCGEQGGWGRREQLRALAPHLG